MRTENPHNQSKERPRTDIDGISNKNLLAKELVRSMHEFIKSVTEINNKVLKPKTYYNEAINNLIYKNRSQKVIDQKLQNLDFHQT